MHSASRSRIRFLQLVGLAAVLALGSAAQAIKGDPALSEAALRRQAAQLLRRPLSGRTGSVVDFSFKPGSEREPLTVYLTVRGRDGALADRVYVVDPALVKNGTLAGLVQALKPLHALDVAVVRPKSPASASGRASSASAGKPVLGPVYYRRFDAQGAVDTAYTGVFGIGGRHHVVQIQTGRRSPARAKVLGQRSLAVVGEGEYRPYRNTIAVDIFAVAPGRWSGPVDVKNTDFHSAEGRLEVVKALLAQFNLSGG